MPISLRLLDDVDREALRLLQVNGVRPPPLDPVWRRLERAGLAYPEEYRYGSGGGVVTVWKLTPAGCVHGLD